MRRQRPCKEWKPPNERERLSLKKLSTLFLCVQVWVSRWMRDHMCIHGTGRAQPPLLGSILLVFEAGSVTEQELDKLARLADWPASWRVLLPLPPWYLDYKHTASSWAFSPSIFKTCGFLSFIHEYQIHKISIFRSPYSTPPMSTLFKTVSHINVYFTHTHSHTYLCACVCNLESV